MLTLKQAQSALAQLAARSPLDAQLQGIVRAIQRGFATVGWNIRLGRHCRSDDLLRLFANGDINDSLLDTMVNLLSRQLDETLQANTIILNTDTPLIMSLDHLWTNYTSEPQLAAIRALAHKIKTYNTQRIIFPLNVGGVHWAAVEVDLTRRTIRHGDSLDWPLPGEWIARIRRWLRHIVPDEFSVGPPIPVPAQDDTFSCAIITLNTILRLVSDAAPWNVQERDLRRLEWVVSWHA
jgi:Ulp1 family protease